ncbi:hypothetical protein ABH15_09965 [Methanoculleus taiwanensis]|uniref:Integrase SSV1 C-terminal domain-containing protein n=2 Tax=Methanoculleus taiwanensis TaxID=1550565 RepID=A0A498H2R8_9EURY|nr:hypothetical protein ABH15_09965 [Methanoculleus taiwanensis]
MGAISASDAEYLSDKSADEESKAKKSKEISKPPESINSLFKRFKKEYGEYLLNVRKITEKKARWYINDMEKLPPISSVPDLVLASLRENSTKAFRNFIHFLEDLKGYDSILGIPPERWLKPAKVKQSGVVEIYVSNDEIREAYEHCPDELKTFFRLMMYSGSRGTHLIGLIKSFDIRQVIIDEEYPEVAHYPTSELAKGTKRTFHVYFPASLVSELKCYSLPYEHEDTIYKKLAHDRVNSKTIRKWHMNFMIKQRVTESIADFIQGRAAATVGSAHYLNKVQNATEEYEKLIGKFPI